MSALWLHLTQLPLFWLTLTLLVYMAVQWLYQRTRSFPLLNPVLLSIVVLVTLLYLTDTPYDTYFAGSQFIHFLLGPATVALAIPLYLTLGRIRQLFLPIVAALVVGCITGILSAIWLSQWLGASDVITLSLAPKSVTTPIAMASPSRLADYHRSLPFSSFSPAW
ncbi:MAG: LrgB family protein [Chloroflexaceae bacterium]|nr:LrgB family protein [Chloroflexaceae bacterium]